MNVLLKSLITFLVLALSPFVNSQIVEEPVIECDPALKGQYDRLIEQSKNRSREETIGWLNSAITECPRYEYFVELGKLWAQSSDGYLQSSAADVFHYLKGTAPTDVQELNTLFHHARLLARMDDPQSAKELVVTAQNLLSVLDPSMMVLKRDLEKNLNRLDEGINVQLSEYGALEVTRNLVPPKWPPETESKWLNVGDIPGLENIISTPETNLVEVQDILRKALTNGNYQNEYYFQNHTYPIPTEILKACAGIEDEGTTAKSDPKGFVIVTHTQPTNSNWEPLKISELWKNIYAAARTISTPFFKPVDYERKITYVVYDGIYMPSECKVKPVDLTKRITGLPDAFDQEFSSEYTILALIYEYMSQVDQEDSTLEIVNPGEEDTYTQVRTVEPAAAEHIRITQLKAAILKAAGLAEDSNED